MKTKYAILVLLLATSISAYCIDGRGFKRVYFGFAFTPEVSYRYLVNNYVAPGSSSSTNQSDIASENKSSTPQFGASATFKVGINLTRWLAVESGVGYKVARFTENLGPNYTIIPGININDSFNVRRETYNYMSVPVGLRFSMGHRKVRGIIAAGVDLDFLFRQKTEEMNTYIPSMTSETVYQTRDFNTFNVSPYLGVGIDCYLSPGAVLRLMPVAQIQSLKNINEPISEYLWNVGFNLSFLFGL